MANIKIEYLYRDASNYKAYPDGDVIVEGELCWSDFESVLHMQELFIPSQLSLPDLQSKLENFPNEDDHIWHQLLSLETTDQDPTVEVTAADIKGKLREIERRGWDKTFAIEKLEALK